MTTPPQEWPTRTTGPVCASSTRRVAATSSASEVSGFWTETTFRPLACRRGTTRFHAEPSAKAPCTSTTVVGVAGADAEGTAPDAAVASPMAAMAMAFLRRLLM